VPFVSLPCTQEEHGPLLLLVCLEALVEVPAPIRRRGDVHVGIVALVVRHTRLGEVEKFVGAELRDRMTCRRGGVVLLKRECLAIRSRTGILEFQVLVRFGEICFVVILYNRLPIIPID